MTLLKSLLVSTLVFSTLAVAETANPLANAKESVQQAVNSTQHSAKSAVSDKITAVKTEAVEKAATVKDKAVTQATQSTQTARETLNTAKSTATQAVENTQKVAKTSKININTADVATLQQLDGIGAVKAKAIVEYRQKHGAFKKAADLANVNGIGEATIENIKSSISFK